MMGAWFLRKYMAIILLFFVAFLSSCEKNIEGVIVDPFGKGVENAEIQIPGSAFKSKTNSKGEFSLDYVPGEIVVRFTKEGYTSHKISLNIQQKYSYPLDTLVMYPMPKGNRMYYLGNDSLIPLNLIKGVSKIRNNYGWTTTYLLKVSDRVINENEPVVLPSGEATFIDMYPGIMKLVKLNSQNVFEDFTVHFPDERRYRYNGLIKDKIERVGEEQVLIRKINLEDGLYAWIEYHKTFGMGTMASKRGKLTLIQVNDDKRYKEKTNVKSNNNESLSSYDIVDGKKIYNENCVGCHSEGVLDAPRVGDVGEWKSRIKQGIPVMIDKTIKGYKAEGYMPAKGGAVHLSNESFANAVAYMVYQSIEKEK